MLTLRTRDWKASLQAIVAELTKKHDACKEPRVGQKRLVKYQRLKLTFRPAAAAMSTDQNATEARVSPNMLALPRVS